MNNGGAVLGSGSKANAYLFRMNGLSVLVDNGFSYRELCRRLQLAGTGPSEIDYLCVSHGHCDHVRGVERFLSRHQVPCFISHGAAAQTGIAGRHVQKIDAHREYSFDGFRFRTFALSHDSPGTLGFSLLFEGIQCTIITDTGTISDEMRAEASQAQLLFLEANYCPDMLENGPYPYQLKKRIRSEVGHLSNDDAAAFLASLETGPRNVFFCHLSGNNNTTQRVTKKMKNALNGRYAYTVCPGNEFVPFRFVTETG